MNNSYIVIMAGGVGSRFWPASRENKPKQFLDILNVGKSLLQMTYDRSARIVSENNILIVSNYMYKDLIKEQLPNLNDTQLLLEPSRNNTAPCVAYTSLHLQAINSNAVFAVLPSDHIIKKEEDFISKMKESLKYASGKDVILTLGITPDRPDTGYGYIRFEKNKSKDRFYKVLEFIEKPDNQKAKEYLEAGDYFWNAGIFIWSVKTILRAFSQSAPDILDILSEEVHHYGTSFEQQYINKVYSQTRKVSVDYAILEHAQNVETLAAKIGWSDLGTWNSLYSYASKDERGNVIQAANSLLQEGSGNLLRIGNKKKLIVLRGLENFIIVDDDNVLLIYPREKEQEIKELRMSLIDSPFV